MHAPNHGREMLVVTKDRTGQEIYRSVGFLALSTRARIHERDTGLVLLSASTYRSVLTVNTTDQIVPL